MQYREKRRIVMLAFDQTWDRVFARFRSCMPAPAAEFAAEEVYRRLASRLTSSMTSTAAVGTLIEAIVAEMLPVEACCSLTTGPNQEVPQIARQSA
ncbi:MAG: hypothetical protein MK074_09090 [Phycisphaerales bacterium]|nr:hypothetical protein [Phycisphaerales bacterium]